MEINISLISVEKILFSDCGSGFLYGDFNVMNIIFEKKINLNNNIKIYPDSSLVYFVLKYYYGYKYGKIVSTDLQNNLFKIALKMNKSIFLFGDSEDALLKIKMKFSLDNGRIETFSGYDYCNYDVLEKINFVKPDILFVGLGAGRQENWIVDNLPKLDVGIVLSVGGWFQYLSGIKNRGPSWMLNYHLEWLFKLLFEFPRVWRRYTWGATIFLLRIFSNKIRLVLK